VFALIISIGMNVPYFIAKISDDDNKVNQIGYIQSTADEVGTVTGDQLRDFFAQMEGSDLLFKGYETTGDHAKDEALLKDAMKDGDLYGYIEFGDLSDSGFPKITFKSEKLLEYSISGKIQNALQLIRQDRILSQSGLSAEQLAQLNAA